MIIELNHSRHPKHKNWLSLVTCEDCQKERLILRNDAKAGRWKLCLQCSRKKNVIDLSGKKFGKLTLLKRVGFSRQDKARYECLCDCGNQFVSYAFTITKGKKTSCGCENIQRTGSAAHNWKGCGEISGSFWARIKLGAEVREIEFNISIEEAWEQFLKQDKKCVFTGQVLVFSARTQGGCDGTASLDRINSLKGYITGNIQWVHKWINIMKSDFTSEEFIEMCEKVVKHARGHYN
jgi:hypothetical protein